jgi:hypothetical protein
MRVKIVCVRTIQGVASVCMRTGVPSLRVRCTRGDKCLRTYGTRGGNYSRTNRGGKSMLDIKSYNSMRSSVPDPDVFGSLDPHTEP